MKPLSKLQILVLSCCCCSCPNQIQRRRILPLTLEVQVPTYFPLLSSQSQPNPSQDSSWPTFLPCYYSPTHPHHYSASVPFRLLNLAAYQRALFAYTRSLCVCACVCESECECVCVCAGTASLSLSHNLSLTHTHSLCVCVCPPLLPFILFAAHFGDPVP